MHRDPAVRGGGFHGHGIFLIAATSLSELLIDDGDRQSPGMIGLDRVRQFEQFPLGRVRTCKRTTLLEFHLCCIIAMSMTSEGVVSALTASRPQSFGRMYRRGGLRLRETFSQLQEILTTVTTSSPISMRGEKVHVAPKRIH
jgi:hypothetical protein